MPLGNDLGEFANGVRPGPGKGVVLQHSTAHKGRIVMSGSFTELDVTGPRAGDTTPTDLVWFSDDGGSSYSLSKSRLLLVDETSLAELGNGSVLLNLRNAGATTAKIRLQSRSDDGGTTWGPIVPAPDLPSPGCEGSIASDGETGDLYFSNPSSTQARINMTVHRSTDGGTTWPRSVVVNPGASAYSCLIDLTAKPGTLGLLYETNDGTKQAYGDLRFAVVGKDSF